MKCDLREARIAIGLSAEKLAHSVGVSRQTIENIERGRTIPNVFLAIDLSNKVGKSLDELFKRNEVKGG